MCAARGFPGGHAQRPECLVLYCTIQYTVVANAFAFSAPMIVTQPAWRCVAVLCFAVLCLAQRHQSQTASTKSISARRYLVSLVRLSLALASPGQVKSVHVHRFESLLFSSPLLFPPSRPPLSAALVLCIYRKNHPKNAPVSSGTPSSADADPEPSRPRARAPARHSRLERDGKGHRGRSG